MIEIFEEDKETGLKRVEAVEVKARNLQIIEHWGKIKRPKKHRVHLVRLTNSLRKEQKTKKIIVTRKQYLEYINSPRWKKKKNKFLKYYGRICMKCGRTPKDNVFIDVHHINYQNLGFETYKDVIILCRECHGQYHISRHSYFGGLIKSDPLYSWKKLGKKQILISPNTKNIYDKKNTKSVNF